MLFDFTCHIIINVCRRNQAILCSAIHCLGIDIVHFCVILDQPSAFLPQFKVFDGFVIYGLTVFIGDWIKVNFWFNDVQ